MLPVTELTSIQPTLAAVMMDYARRLSLTWFAAQAGNWDYAGFEVGGMHDTQHIGETTEPDRAPSLRAFASAYLDPLSAAIDAKDIARFRTTYAATIQGCNSCHAGTVDSDFPQGHGFIKVQVPTNTLDSILVFAPTPPATAGASASGFEVGNPSPGDTIHAGGYSIAGVASLGIDHIDIFLDNRDAGGSTLGSVSSARTTSGRP
jgi:hypothetical protein